jgi:hypothetical protein
MTILCYVRGCTDHGIRGSVRSTVHPTFGRVTACRAHDPSRFYAVDLVQPAPAPMATPDPQLGDPAPIHPRDPRPLTPSRLRPEPVIAF